MAERPVFLPVLTAPYFEEKKVIFTWHSGFSSSQKQKNIQALASASREQGIRSLLEISTKASSMLGQSLSAFNLDCQVGNLHTKVENAFQGSKVFELGGPFTDLYKVSPREAKKDKRLRESGQLLEFNLLGEKWKLKPLTAFYDWLYINAARQRGFASELTNYEAFSDIEFNPAKSINCQARSLAVYVSLHRNGLLDHVLTSKNVFIEEVYPNTGGSQTSML